MNSAQLLKGGCHCGAVRYACGLPVSKPGICHCESCRRTIGANAIPWMTVDRASFRLERGTLREYASSEGVVRGFCERCGCSLSYAHRKYPTEIDLTIASLDDAEAIVPTAHIWMSDAMSWDRPGDGLPQHAGWRSAPPD